MQQIFDQLKSLITPEMISRASATLGEHDSKVATAISTIIPGLLGKLLQKGNSSQVEGILKEAGNSNVSSELGNIFSCNTVPDQQNIGDKFLDAIMGGKTNEFTSAVSSHSGIAPSNANKLTNMVATATAGFLGDKLTSGNMTLSGLLSELNKEKGSIMNALPSALIGTLGLSSILGPNRTVGTTKNTGKKKGYGWVIWLVLIIVLLLLIIFGWRSCRNRNMNDTVNNMADRTSEYVDTMSNRTSRAVASVTNRTEKEIRLPNNTTIQGYQGGMEEKMIDYINSNDYKNATTTDDLRRRWFEFEDIDFAHGSATELSEGSQRHLNNIVAIMKAYPNTRIRIAGYADKTGTEQVNQNISEQRANHIKSILVKGGINAQRISTEGFGDEYATRPASASDADRAVDRDIAFRFVK